MSKAAPAFKSLKAAKEFYNELSAPPQFIYKTVVKVYPSTNRQAHAFIDVAVHTDPDNLRLSQFQRANPRRVEPAYFTDEKGRKRLRQKKEFTSGSLYAPQSGHNGPGWVDYEWALCFKIDGDLARRKTGHVEDGLIHYIVDLDPASDKRMRKARKRLAKVNDSIGGRLPKSNSQDLTERYGRSDPEVLDWIKRNSAELDNADFSHDNYTDMVLRHAVPLSQAEGGDGHRNFEENY